jgi:antitoxin VapB
VDLQDKVERVVRVSHAHRLGGILLSTQANFAWMTGGRSNRIDGTRELGAGAILITADGRRLIVANTIELPRLLQEALVDIPCEPVEYPWVDDHRDPGTLLRLARKITTSADIGADWPLDGAVRVDAEIVRARGLLTGAEIERYRALGRDIGAATGRVCRALTPGISELEIARRAVDATAAIGARATVTLVAGDDRIVRFRHPVATSRLWERLVMLVLCVERDGLVVALTRLVSAGPVPLELVSKTHATARVFERLLDETRAGVRGRDLYAIAAAAYAQVGAPGEERRHHQGGPIGYQARDWFAHPACNEQVQARQAFAWNPSITGTKIEDTALVIDDRIELITATADWPSIEMTVRGQTLAAAAVLAT